MKDLVFVSEVWNPGALPPGLTLEKLRTEHPSIPRNPLIADPLFLAHYIEKAGTGTLAMIDGCRQAGLPEPEFREEGSQFVLTLWRDWLTEAFIDGLGLNERQKQGLTQLRKEGRIRSSDYQTLTGSSRQTATRDLDDLVRKGVILRVGAGRGAHYVKAKEMPQK